MLNIDFNVKSERDAHHDQKKIQNNIDSRGGVMTEIKIKHKIARFVRLHLAMIVESNDYGHGCDHQSGSTIR